MENTILGQFKIRNIKELIGREVILADKTWFDASTSYRLTKCKKYIISYIEEDGFYVSTVWIQLKKLKSWYKLSDFELVPLCCKDFNLFNLKRK